MQPPKHKSSLLSESEYAQSIHFLYTQPGKTFWLGIHMRANGDKVSENGELSPEAWEQVGNIWPEHIICLLSDLARIWVFWTRELNALSHNHFGCDSMQNTPGFFPSNSSVQTLLGVKWLIFVLIQPPYESLFLSLQDNGEKCFDEGVWGVKVYRNSKMGKKSWHKSRLVRWNFNSSHVDGLLKARDRVSSLSHGGWFAMNISTCSIVLFLYK